MNTQRSKSFTKHDEAVAVEGLDDLFQWASVMVGGGEDSQGKQVREQRIRRQVLEVVQHVREKEATTRAQEEITYLQRRVIALLQKLEERTEELGSLRQVLVIQTQALEAMPKLEEKIQRLSSLEARIEAYQQEQQELLTALSKLKTERDFLDELLSANEQENNHLSRLLLEARQEITKLKSRRWWHIFC